MVQGYTWRIRRFKYSENTLAVGNKISHKKEDLGSVKHQYLTYRFQLTMRAFTLLINV
jgi:hypothetical protein